MHRMKRIKLHDRSFRLMIEADVIDREIERVGAQINRELAGERPLFLGVLNGAFMFVADLLKHITIDGAEISFVKIASYAGLSSTGKVQDLIGLREDIAGRTVVILEDMIDYKCIALENDFVVGHGLDYDGLGRNYPDLYTIEN